jgi:hypothetical protein
VSFVYGRVLAEYKASGVSDDLMSGVVDNISEEEKAMIPLFIYPFTSFLVRSFMCWLCLVPAYD